MNESESLGLHSYNQPSDPLSAREAEIEERREQFSLEERLKMSTNDAMHCPFCGETRVNPRPMTLGGKTFGFEAMCQECESTGPWGESKEQALERWNRRAK